jgi:hypothetical protein
MRQQSWTVLAAVVVALPAFAQSSVPSITPSLLPKKIVRVRTGYSTGLLGSSGTIVEPGSIRSFDSSPNRKLFPNTNMKVRITKKEWDELLRAVDLRALADLTSPSGCPACTDRPRTCLEVEFNDGTHKVVDYDRSNPPSPIRTILEAIQAIRSSHMHSH